MTTAIKRRRGTTTQHSTFTGLEGELTVDTTKKTVVVHDGSTAGGFPLAKESQATSNVAITGGSINGTTVGVTTPSTGKFTTLEATGVTTVQAGTVSAPAITTSGDTNTGIFFPAADTIAFTEGGVEAMRIDSSGNVGIGVTTAGARLQANNTKNTTTAILGTTGSLTNNDWGQLGFSDGTSTVYGAIRNIFLNPAANGSTALAFLTTTTGNTLTEAMRIDSSGNVGIGTSSPDAVGFTVAKSTSSDTGIRVQNSTGAAVFVQGASAAVLAGLSTNPLTFYTNANERMRIDSSGNVLVGITSARANAGDVQVSKGISFPATQSAQSDANTLDDYEEGTYTPVANSLTGSITSYTSSGKYTKIGNIVSVFGEVALTDVGTAGSQLQITLPFNPSYANGTDQPSGTSREAVSTGYIYFTVISTSSNKITIQNSTNGGITWTNGYKYPFQITYFV